MADTEGQVPDRKKEKRNLNRRDLLKLAGITAVGLTGVTLGVRERARRIPEGNKTSVEAKLIKDLLKTSVFKASPRVELVFSDKSNRVYYQQDGEYYTLFDDPMLPEAKFPKIGNEKEMLIQANSDVLEKRAAGVLVSEITFSGNSTRLVEIINDPNNGTFSDARRYSGELVERGEGVLKEVIQSNIGMTFAVGNDTLREDIENLDLRNQVQIEPRLSIAEFDAEVGIANAKWSTGDGRYELIGSYNGKVSIQTAERRGELSVFVSNDEQDMLDATWSVLKTEIENGITRTIEYEFAPRTNV